MLHNCITKIMLSDNVRNKDPSLICLTELLTNSGNEPGLVSHQDTYLTISKNTLYKVNGSITRRVLYLVEVSKRYTCRDVTTVLTSVQTKKPNNLTLSERD
jgi:hypothetical protein